MVIAVLAVPVFIALIVVVRRRRKAVLAGLNANRPVFSVEPPTRRVSSRKHEAL